MLHLVWSNSKRYPSVYETISIRYRLPWYHTIDSSWLSVVKNPRPWGPGFFWGGFRTSRATTPKSSILDGDLPLRAINFGPLETFWFLGATTIFSEIPKSRHFVVATLWRRRQPRRWHFGTAVLVLGAMPTGIRKSPRNGWKIPYKQWENHGRHMGKIMGWMINGGFFFGSTHL